MSGDKLSVGVPIYAVKATRDRYVIFGGDNCVILTKWTENGFKKPLWQASTESQVTLLDMIKLNDHTLRVAVGFQSNFSVVDLNLNNLNDAPKNLISLSPPKSSRVKLIKILYDGYIVLIVYDSGCICLFYPHDQSCNYSSGYGIISSCDLSFDSKTDQYKLLLNSDIIFTIDQWNISPYQILNLSITNSFYDKILRYFVSSSPMNRDIVLLLVGDKFIRVTNHEIQICDEKEIYASVRHTDCTCLAKGDHSFAVGTVGGDVVVYDFELRQKYKVHTGLITSIALLDDIFFSADVDGTLRANPIVDTRTPIGLLYASYSIIFFYFSVMILILYAHF